MLRNKVNIRKQAAIRVVKLEMMESEATAKAVLEKPPNTFQKSSSLPTLPSPRGSSTQEDLIGKIIKDRVSKLYRERLKHEKYEYYGNSQKSQPKMPPKSLIRRQVQLQDLPARYKSREMIEEILQRRRQTAFKFPTTVREDLKILERSKMESLDIEKFMNSSQIKSILKDSNSNVNCKEVRFI